MNADIRLSANSVKLGALAAGSTAASASLRDGRLEIGVARAGLGDGSLAGDVAVVAGDAPAIEAQVRANNVDLARVAPDLGLPKGISGAGSIVADVTAGGNNLGALVDGLNGTARLDVRQGAIPLFGLAKVAADAGLAQDPGLTDDLTPVAVDTMTAGLDLLRRRRGARAGEARHLLLHGGCTRLDQPRRRHAGAERHAGAARRAGGQERRQEGGPLRHQGNPGASRGRGAFARQLALRALRIPRARAPTSVAMTTPVVTSPTRMVEMALISGVTPSRTWL